MNDRALDMLPLCSTPPVQLYTVVLRTARMLFRKGKAASSVPRPSSPSSQPHSSFLSPQPELVWVVCPGLAIERERHGRDSGELRRLLNSLECKQDEYTKSMILHSITRCVYLLETEVREWKQEVPSSQPGPWGYS